MRSSASLSHYPRRLPPRSTIAIAKFPNSLIPRLRKTCPPGRCRRCGCADRRSTQSCRTEPFLRPPPYPPPHAGRVGWGSVTLILFALAWFHAALRLIPTPRPQLQDSALFCLAVESSLAG